MNREHWKEMLPIITAFVNGEQIEGRRTDSDEWERGSVFEFSRNPECYRIVPRIIRIGAFDVPEPYQGEIKHGQKYWVADQTLDKFCNDFTWRNDGYDTRYLQRGLIHLTPEAAALHGKALASLTAGEGVEL